jgi:hypothetical protein
MPEYESFIYDRFYDEWLKDGRSIVTRRFEYRTANPKEMFIIYQDEEFPYGDAYMKGYRKLHSLLAEMSPVRENGKKEYADNHDGYELTSVQSGQKVYVFFSDWHIYLSRGFELSRW